MAELDLPRGPAELLEAVREPLADHLGGEHHLRLGGGTALAARWAHRHSTDVDLFVRREPYLKLMRNSEQFTADLERHTRAVEHVGVLPGYTLIMLRQAEITVLASSPLTEQAISSDTVRGTRIAFETNAEILAKKLTHRLSYRVYVPRDVYDIATARRLDPMALNTALGTLPLNHLHDIREELGLLGPDWARNHREPVLHPTHSQDADDSLAIVQRVIGRHIDGREPPTHRPDTSPSRAR